jgi:hypothetical protein
MAETILLIFEVTIFSFGINLPFGHLRAPTKKFSVAWFAYIHLPIPAIIVFRKVAGLGYEFIPIFFAAAILGQIIGARLNRPAQALKMARKGIVEDA